MGVDPDAAEVERLGDPHGPAEVLRPHARREPVVDAVGPADRLGLVVEPLHGDDRAEDLVLDRLVVLTEPGDHGRLEEEAVAQRRHAVATRPDGGVVGQPVEEPGDPVQLARVVDRPEQGVVVVRHPDLGRAARILAERRDEVVVDARSGEHPGGRGAVLTGVEVPRDGDPLDRLLEVGVVEDDDRRLAAELEVHPFDLVRCALGDLHTGPDRPGDGDQGGGRVLDHGPPGVAVAADDVERAGGQELGGQLGQLAAWSRGWCRSV